MSYPIIINPYNWTNAILWGGYAGGEAGSVIQQKARSYAFMKEDRYVFTINSLTWGNTTYPGGWDGYPSGSGFRTQYLYTADGANPDISNNTNNFFVDTSCNITGPGSHWVWPAAGNYSNPTRNPLSDEDPLSNVIFPFLTFTVDGSGVYCLIIFDRSIMGPPWGDTWRGIYLLYTLDGTKSPSTTADWNWSLIDSPGNPDLFGLGGNQGGISRPQSFQIEVQNGSVYVVWTDVASVENNCASSSHIKYAFCSDITVANPEWNVSIVPGSLTTGLNLQMYVDNNIVILSYCDWDGVSGSELLTGGLGTPTWYDWNASSDRGFGNLIFSYTLNGNSAIVPPQWVSETLTQLMIAPIRTSEYEQIAFPFVISKLNDIGGGGSEDYFDLRGGFTMKVNKIADFSPYQVGGGTFSQYQVYFVFFPQWTSEDASGGATNLPSMSGSDGIIWFYNLNALAPADPIYVWTSVYDASGPQGLATRIGPGFPNPFAIYQGDLFHLSSQYRANTPPYVYILAPAAAYDNTEEIGLPSAGLGLIMWWRTSPPDWRFSHRYIMPDASWNEISNYSSAAEAFELPLSGGPIGFVFSADFSITEKMIWLAWTGNASNGGGYSYDESDYDNVCVAWLNVPVIDAGQAGNF